MFFKAAIFDLDNTLYNYTDCHQQALSYTLPLIALETGAELSLIQEYYQDISKQLKYELGFTAAAHNRLLYFKAIYERLKQPLSSLLHMHDIYWSHFYQHMQLLPGVKKFLTFLQQQGIKIYILTDFDCEHQLQKMVRLDILNLITGLLTSEELGIEKPSTKVYATLLQRIRLNSEQVLMFGDNAEKDIQGACRLGIYGCWYRPGSPWCLTNNQLTYGNYADLFHFFSTLAQGIEELVTLSRYCGERFDLVQAGGGNISIKIDNLLVIKASGEALSDVNTTQGYSLILGTKLQQAVLTGYYPPLQTYTIFNSLPASMETYMHTLLKKYTLHLHPIQVNRYLLQAEESLRVLCPMAQVINYATPGEELCRLIANTPTTNLYFLKNHGLIYTSDNYIDLLPALESLLDLLEHDMSSKYRVVNKISALLNRYGSPVVTYLAEDPIFQELPDKIFFPDQVVYGGPAILRLDCLEPKAIDNYLEQYGVLPSVINYNQQLYFCAKTLVKCQAIEAVLKSVLLIEGIETCEGLSPKEIKWLTQLEAEKYRKNK